MEKSSTSTVFYFGLGILSIKLRCIISNPPRIKSSSFSELNLFPCKPNTKNRHRLFVVACYLVGIELWTYIVIDITRRSVSCK